jgi:folate-binding protein YgfZ
MSVASSQNEVATEVAGSREEFAALRSACGVYELGSRSKIELRGSDRVRWLNGMVTNNVRDLAEGHGVYAFLLNPQGHIQGDLYAYHRGESILVDVEQAQAPQILALFDRYIIMDDVEVTTLSDLTAIGVSGPRSSVVLRAAGIEVPDLQPLQFDAAKWNNIAITLVRGDNPSVPSYELWLSAASAAGLEESLRKAGAKSVSPAALDLLRIASGIPRYGQDIRERDLPQETEQTRALHFSKGCYIGQEIVERIRSRGSVHRKFTGFEIDGGLPAAGAKIEIDGKDVGEITSAASLPLEGSRRSVALGYIRREIGTPGKKVRIGGSEAVVAAVPFQNIF